MLKQTESLIHAAEGLVASADFLPPDTKQELISDLRAYLEQSWKRSGWLARIGLPRCVVNPLRSLRGRVESTVQHFRRLAVGTR